MDSEVAKTYGNKVRIRVCGLCRENDSILMVNHSGITPTDFWAPPGGGVDFGQSVVEALKKEFREETHLEIAVGAFAFGCEYINAPIHSIELFFDVQITGGKLRTGHDPELQIIRDVAFLSPADLRAMSPDVLHGIFRLYTETAQLKDLKGFYRI